MSGQNEAIALMMRGLAAENGLTDEMETIIAQLKEVKAKAVEKLGAEKGEVAFACGFTVLSIDLSK